VPNAAPERAYDIKYYPRDVRRNVDAADTLFIESSFTGDGAKLLEGAKLVPQPHVPSAGMKVSGHRTATQRHARPHNTTALFHATSV
jgi:hypothetical protein